MHVVIPEPTPAQRRLAELKIELDEARKAVAAEHQAKNFKIVVGDYENWTGFNWHPFFGHLEMVSHEAGDEKVRVIVDKEEAQEMISFLQEYVDGKTKTRSRQELKEGGFLS